MLSILNCYELGVSFYFLFVYFSRTWCFMIFTDVYHVNVNIALELANQSVHDIGFKHKPYVINVCKWYFYDRELNRARTSLSFVNLYIHSSHCCQNVLGTFIFDSPLFSTIPSTEAHQILTNNQHVCISGLCCVLCVYSVILP